ncbi:DNA primase [Streptomyces sp. TG1A-60]|uniref:DNA primase n=1 Tax=Streptomyces sp. TG1A-60 TaxID=3129111 RepID=UPI0030CFF08C
MNRVGLGLAIGAGYVLGRTKKMKVAFAVGTMVAGKRMQLSPRALADLVSRQLQDNPQFKEIGDQLREDLRGVGKAATGALVERRIEGLADRLHGRTSQVRDQLSGAAPDLPGRGRKRRDDEVEDAYAGDDEDADAREEYDGEPEEKPSRDRTAKRPPSKAGKPAARKAPGKKPTARKTAAKKNAPGKAPAEKAARKATGARATRGGGDDD